MDNLRKKELNPMILVHIGIVIVLIVVYFAWLRPGMDAGKAAADFNTPEAQAKRDPDQRKVSQSLQQKIEALRAKENHLDRGTMRRGGKDSRNQDQ